MTWADTYDTSPVEKKRIVIAAVVEKVSVLDKDHVEVVLFLSMLQFLGS